MQQHVGEWRSWWFGLLLPLLVLAAWHCTDAFYRVTFALKRGGRCHYRLPPGHMGIPLLGETLALLWYFKVVRRPDDFILAKRRAYGDQGIYRTHLFGSPAVVVCSPAANKLVLQSPDSFRARRPAQDLLGLSSMFNVEGSQHARLRSFVVATVNSPASLRTLARAVQPRIVAALLSWAEKGTITAATEIRKVMFENICMMFVSMQPSHLTEEMDGWFSGLLAGLRTLPFDLPGTALNHARKCRRKLTAVFREELARRKNLTAREEGEKQEEDVMSGLMRMKDEQGKKLSDDEVVDNIVTLVVGAYDTTANTITWAAYHLAKSPHVLAKLREENMEIAKDKSRGPFITPDDVSKMKYTAKVVEETIRIANIASMLFRVAYKDVQYGGYTIPHGWQVVVWLRSLHTDPKYYDDPLTFNPDRWDKPAKPGTYQVFGGGYRVCAGNMLARLQITIMLHHLSLGYEWELINPDAPIDYLPHAKPVDGAVMAFRKLSKST